MSTIFAYARLNARITPISRGELFEDPLDEALQENGLGSVTGGGTMQTQSGEIAYCGIDIDVLEPAKGISFICQFLTQHGAPKGSQIEYRENDEKIVIPFGNIEGIAIYLNGTDLPANVYQECDVNVVYDEINRLLEGRGQILGYWEGPKETALYLYGRSAVEMENSIAGYLAANPLCQLARIVKIA